MNEPIDPLSQKFSGIPDPSVLVDGSTNPIKAARLRKKSANEIEVNTVVCFDPSTGQYGCPQIANLSTGTAEAQRAMTVWKKAGPLTTAADQTIWTPSAGKRVRLLGVSIVVDPTTTSAAMSLITLKDITNATVYDYLLALNTTAPATPYRAQAPLSPNGYLFPKDAAIGIAIGSALTAGGVYVNMWGTEE